MKIKRCNLYDALCANRECEESEGKIGERLGLHNYPSESEEVMSPFKQSKVAKRGEYTKSQHSVSETGKEAEDSSLTRSLMKFSVKRIDENRLDSICGIKTAQKKNLLTPATTCQTKQLRPEKSFSRIRFKTWKTDDQPTKELNTSTTQENILKTPNKRLGRSRTPICPPTPKKPNRRKLSPSQSSTTTPRDSNQNKSQLDDDVSIAPNSSAFKTPVKNNLAANTFFDTSHSTNMQGLPKPFAGKILAEDLPIANLLPISLFHKKTNKYIINTDDITPPAQLNHSNVEDEELTEEVIFAFDYPKPAPDSLCSKFIAEFKRLKNFHVTAKRPEVMTHLVIPFERVEAGMKLIMGLLYKTLIIEESYMEDCLAKKKLLKADGYEIKWVPKPADRPDYSQFFPDVNYYVVAGMFGEDWDDYWLIYLLIEMKKKVVRKPEKADIVIANPRDLALRKGKDLTDYMWIIDSILQGKAVDRQEYIFSLD